MLFYALIIYAFGQTPKEKCQYIRLDETEASLAEERKYNHPPRQKTLKDVPVYSQNGFGICYAAAAAQVYDALQHLHGGDRSKNISPLSWAVGFRANPENRSKYTRYDDEKEQIKYSFEGGGLCDIFNDQENTRSACTRAEVEQSVDKNLKQEHLDALYYLFEVFTIDDTVAREEISPFGRTAKDLVNDLQYCGVAPVEKAVSALGDVLRSTADEASEYFDRFLHRTCTKQRTRFKADCQNIYPPNISSAISTINQHFDQPDPVLPLGFAFCQRVLSKHGSSYVGFTANGERPEAKEDCGKHAALLAGRRWNSETNTCQFLIRNSYGTSCNKYLDEFKSDCDMGNIWVNEDVIGKNTYKIHKVTDTTP
jgi:hypothetical protein